MAVAEVVQLKEAAEKVQRLAGDLRKEVADFKAGAVTKAEFDERTEKVNKLIDELEQKMAEWEAKRIEPKETEEAKEEKKAADYKKAFLQWCRVGDDGLSQEQKQILVKDLSGGIDAEGGFTVPEDFRVELLKTVQEFSPVRAVARVIGTSRDQVTIPSLSAHPPAQWVAETAARPVDATMAFGQKIIPVHENTYVIHVSQRLIEDSAFNIESLLREEFGEGFGVLEGTAFMNGTGSGQPQGARGAASIGTHTATGAARTLAYDDLVDAMHKVKEAYHPRAAWFMPLTTIGSVRKMVVGDSLVWQPSLGPGNPPTILGSRYFSSPDLVAEGGAAGDDLAMFGDWTRGYYVVDRVDMQLLRDPFSRAASGEIRFIARRRTGGDVVRPEALILINAGA